MKGTLVVISSVLVGFFLALN